jgi:hypothetical protein
MQKLVLEAQINADVAKAWELFESQPFRDRLSAETGLIAELLSTTQEGTTEVRTFRYESGTDLPAVAAKALGTKRLAYTQTNRLDLAASRLEWRIELPLGDRVRVSGVTTMEPSGSGSLRKVDGTIEVKLPLIGGRVEKLVVEQFEKSMRRVNEIANEMLAE